VAPSLRDVEEFSSDRISLTTTAMAVDPVRDTDMKADHTSSIRASRETVRGVENLLRLWGDSVGTQEGTCKNASEVNGEFKWERAVESKLLYC
jgi:hypothetical protein